MKKQIKLPKAAVIVLSAICIIIAASLFIKLKYCRGNIDNSVVGTAVLDKEGQHSTTTSSTQPPEILTPSSPDSDGSDSLLPEQSNASGGPRSQPEAMKEIQGLVAVKDIDSSIIIDLRYATENNFTHKKVYPVYICVLKENTAQKLKAANEELKDKGYSIKIYDGYRPIEVQKLFWSLVPDSRYVANPYKGGSRHNTGTAVDITLVDRRGSEVEMPSGFDDFTERASRSSTSMSSVARKNMNLLTEAMTKQGFKTIETEWWHFEDAAAGASPLLDVPLEEFLP